MKFAKLGWKLCPILNKYWESYQSHVRFHQSGEISPNLVTLEGTKTKEQHFKPSELQFIFDGLCQNYFVIIPSNKKLWQHFGHFYSNQKAKANTEIDSFHNALGTSILDSVIFRPLSF